MTEQRATSIQKIPPPPFVFIRGHFFRSNYVFALICLFYPDKDDADSYTYWIYYLNIDPSPSPFMQGSNISLLLQIWFIAAICSLITLRLFLSFISVSGTQSLLHLICHFLSTTVNWIGFKPLVFQRRRRRRSCWRRQSLGTDNSLFQQTMAFWSLRSFLFSKIL